MHSSGLVSCDRAKIWTDGGLGAKTAAMLEPYADDPENMGVLQMTGEQITKVPQNCVAEISFVSYFCVLGTIWSLNVVRNSRWYCLFPFMLQGKSTRLFFGFNKDHNRRVHETTRNSEKISPAQWYVKVTLGCKNPLGPEVSIPGHPFHRFHCIKSPGCEPFERTWFSCRSSCYW